jgi:cyclopropane fatty-acyl-phospholipid synthase-like methyltransferase
MSTTTTHAYLEGGHSSDEELWEYASSDYEQRKYALTVASLPMARYENAFEPGCSVGLLSELLALRCARLLAADLARASLALAARRLKSFPHVRVEERTIPMEWPNETFDLIVLSDLACYFDVDTLHQVMERVVDSSAIGAHVVGVHWTDRTDFPLTGNYAHAVMDRTRALRGIVHHVDDRFVLDVWERSS